MLYKSGLRVKPITLRDNYTNFEHSDYYVTIRSVTFRLCVVYRPPLSKRNGFSNTGFFDQWSAFLDDIMLDMNDVIITGDLNFHLDIPTQLDVKRFSETLCDRGMKQLVNVSKPHSKGHILDVVIVRDNTCIVPALPNVYDPCLGNTHDNSSGDHLAISVDVNARNPYGVRKTTTVRRLRQISVSDFLTDIASLSDIFVDGPVGAMVEAYNTGLRRTVEHHAPLVVKTVTLRPNSPWYTDELRREKHNRRRAERIWLRTGLVKHKQVYRAQCVVVNRMLLAAKRNYYTDNIASCGSNQKQFINITKSLMGVSCHAKLPPYVSSNDLAQ